MAKQRQLWIHLTNLLSSLENNLALRVQWNNAITSEDELCVDHWCADHLDNNEIDLITLLDSDITSYDAEWAHMSGINITPND